MSDKRNSTKLLESVGGIRQVISRFGSIANSFTGGPLNSQQVNPTTAILENIDSTIRESINGPRYEIIKGIFEKHVNSERLVDAYTLLCLDAMKTFETNFEDLFLNNDTEITFSDLGITLLNNYRPSTSQIGRKVEQTPNAFIGRHIIQ